MGLWDSHRALNAVTRLVHEHVKGLHGLYDAALAMCKTEISESCWFRFLNEKGLRGPDERLGKRENPMVLSDQPIELVGQFVKWFEEQAADGYTYSLPTVEQWLRSFTGARTEAEATREIGSWFSEDGEFVFQQSERYGQNKVSAIAHNIRRGQSLLHRGRL